MKNPIQYRHQRREYDIFFFGHLTIDLIKTPSEEYEMTSGPILYAAWTAHQLGHMIGILTKTSYRERQRLSELPAKEGVFWRESHETVTNILRYSTEDPERRVGTSLKTADPYVLEDFPELSTKLIYYCSLFTGEVEPGLIRHVSRWAPLALDVQGMLRKSFPDGVVRLVPWEEKAEVMPLCRYFKADADEAAFLTGMDTERHEGRVRAAEKLLDWGAKEVVISHHTELIAASESGVSSAPLRNRKLSGRTGRGDTCFSSYVTERLHREPAEAIRFAAAVTSMKLENRGPFRNSRREVEEFMKEIYRA